MMKLKETEIKKELYKEKTMAKFSHYVSGNLYYTIELKEGVYQFPISVIEEKNDDIIKDMNGSFSVGRGIDSIKLSSDLGTTSFYSEIRGSELNRWISISIKNDEFIKIQ